MDPVPRNSAHLRKRLLASIRPTFTPAAALLALAADANALAAAAEDLAEAGKEAQIAFPRDGAQLVTACAVPE